MTKECPNCGNSLSDSFVRVFGNNEGQVPGCLQCVGMPRLHQWPRHPDLAASID